MNIIKERKRVGAVCPKCGHPEYKMEYDHPLKPKFECDSCGNIWMYGRDGGKYHSLDRKTVRED